MTFIDKQTLSPMVPLVDILATPRLQQNQMSELDRDLQKYNRQLKHGFRTLTFEDDLESEFRNFFHARSVIKQRRAILVGMLLLLLLIPLDLQQLNGDVLQFYLICRVGIIIPMLVAALLITFRERLRHYFALVSFTILAFIGVSTNLLVVYGRQAGLYVPYEGAMVLIMVAFFLGGMYFRQSLLCIATIGLSFPVLCELYLPADPTRLHQYFFIFAVALVGTVAAFTMEYQVRISFLQRGALKSLAQTDPLTGLYNRGAINQKLAHLIEYAYREGKHITLTLVDVDYFKHYNDLYGHLAGDKCLIRVAEVLASGCKRPLDFAGRYGGEEFLLLWFDAAPDEARHLAEQTRSAIQKLAIPHRASLTSGQVSVSCGVITGIPQHSDNAERLLQLADQALYQAKATGRNRIQVSELERLIPLQKSAS